MMEAIYEGDKVIQRGEIYDRRIVKVFVESVSGYKVKVNLPVKVIRSILKSNGKLPIKYSELEGINIEALSEKITTAFEKEHLGEIFNVDSDKGDMIRVLVE
ncbi:hypothetical protein ACQPU1_01820 [Clostridium paraputrificum]|uniref:hypothetical protein n=1 Tax=Clostridium paraputrificum TaxID=29363 RepID=UPI003D33F4E0